MGLSEDGGAYTFGGNRDDTDTGETDPLAGSEGAGDGLIRLSFTDESSTERDYVGVYSNTGDNPDAGTVALRLVLFPVNDPAPQLVLFVCTDGSTSCDYGGAETPNPSPQCSNE